MSESFPDLVQAVIGFRAFNVMGEHLHSAGIGDYAWAPGANTARCKVREISGLGLGENDWPSVHEEPAPVAECSCGFYAWHEITSVPKGLHFVVGAIAAWGAIEVHRDGFRAEKATIVALGIGDEVLFAPSQRKQIERLAARYQVECVALIDLEEAAFKHGIAVPEEMRPEPLPPLPDVAIQPFRSGGSLATGGAVPGSGHHGGAVATGMPGSAPVPGVWGMVSVPTSVPVAFLQPLDPPKPTPDSALDWWLFGLPIYVAVWAVLIALGTPWYVAVPAAMLMQIGFSSKHFRLWRRLGCWWAGDHYRQNGLRCGRCGWRY